MNRTLWPGLSWWLATLAASKLTTAPILIIQSDCDIVVRGYASKRWRNPWAKYADVWQLIGEMLGESRRSIDVRWVKAHVKSYAEMRRHGMTEHTVVGNYVADKLAKNRAAMVELDAQEYSRLEQADRQAWQVRRRIVQATKLAIQHGRGASAEHHDEQLFSFGGLDDPEVAPSMEVEQVEQPAKTRKRKSGDEPVSVHKTHTFLRKH
jgi:hypothetical protein